MCISIINKLIPCDAIVLAVSGHGIEDDQAGAGARQHDNMAILHRIEPGEPAQQLDLPAPLRPNRATNSPAKIRRLSACNTGAPPKAARATTDAKPGADAEIAPSPPKIEA